MSLGSRDRHRPGYYQGYFERLKTGALRMTGGGVVTCSTVVKGILQRTRYAVTTRTMMVKRNDGGCVTERGSRNLLVFWRKIISGGRKTDDLELPCTARHSKLHERLFLSSLEVDSLAWKKLRWTHRMPGSS